ncbi:MAG: intradiol ring-cleavage dioxygenase [Coleofasciculaceae cyanobacterium]
MKKEPLHNIWAASIFKRREVLGFLGGNIAVLIAGCLRGQSASSVSRSQTSPQTAPACVVRPQQTEGPYFVDNKLDRSDIRSDPADGSVKPGVPLRLVFQVSGINGSACQPLSGATVDVWHCDALGVYSDVTDPYFNSVGQKFLRGYQVTNVKGIAEFVTVYPGCYPGRTVHIHFKIRTNSASGRSSEFTSQLYFDDAVTDQVYTQSPYTTKGQRTVRNNQDGIFQGEGEQLLLSLTKNAEGYVGNFAIGLQV